MTKRKIIFMGTPDFAVPALEKLAAFGHEIVAVYTAPPKPAGRGQELKKSKVHEAAEALGLTVLTPSSLKTETLPQADIAVVAAYGILLPKHILEAPKFGCINIHPSLLPRWRGAAPIQRTIMAGDTKTAVCIMQMDEGLDTGAVLADGKFTLEENITAGELHDKCAAVGAEMTIHVINEIEKLKARPQTDEGVTYARKITREDEKIDWAKPAKTIENQIRGLNPFPGAYFEMAGQKIKVFEAEVVEQSGTPGTTLDDKLLVACGENALRINKLQKPGKRAMTAQEFLNGSKTPAGSVL